MVESLSEKEEHILQSAMQVFVEKGWHGTKMQEIADRAGVNKAMLHYYFRSKKRLYEAILEKLFSKFLNSIAESFTPTPGQTFAQTLQLFIDHLHGHLQKNPLLPLFVARELSEGGQVARSVIQKVLQQNKLQTPQIMLNELKFAEKRGEIRPVNHPVQFLLTLIGSCVYFYLARPIVEQLFPEIDFNSPDFIEQRKKMLFEHLYYGLKKQENHL